MVENVSILVCQLCGSQEPVCFYELELEDDKVAHICNDCYAKLVEWGLLEGDC